MEFKVLAIAVLTVIVLIVLIILAINVSGVLEQQVGNATGLFRI